MQEETNKVNKSKMQGHQTDIIRIFKFFVMVIFRVLQPDVDLRCGCCIEITILGQAGST